MSYFIINHLKLIRKTFLTDFIKIHYSQFGEDIILKELIKPDKKDGFYVDVGCYHPKKFSNTFFLHKRGWSGVNIDIEEDKILCFNMARPKAFNFNAAVSDKRERVKRYRFSKYGLGSTIDKAEADLSGENIYDMVEMETVKLDDILDKSPYKDRLIDVLSIDTEGNDFKVLKSLDMVRYRPKIILIESHHQDIEEAVRSEPYKYLASQGYVLCSWTYLTLIFKFPGSDILKG